MGIQIRGEIEKVNGKELSYKDFVERYLSKNQPVLLTGLMDDWRACMDWVTHDGRPNLSFFDSHFGKSIVQVADCGTREFTDQKRLEMSVSQFIRRWMDGSAGHGTSLLYLKDWHFVKEYPEYVAYETPLFFCDDWLNMYLDHHCMHSDPNTNQRSIQIGCSDYRFVYMGVKGSWTPLHADVFRSYSWSANVCGTKRWLFLSPSQTHLIFDRNLKNSVYNIFDDVSEIQFPGLKKTIWLEYTQERNEIIFVPSGWYHQVHNMEDTISINHNWFNAYNLSWVWDLLLRDYKEAKEYIEDIRDICDDFEGLCQRNLAANTGMNFFDFFIFLFYLFLANAVQLYCQHRENGILLWSSSQITLHLAFNILSIRKIVSKMKSVDCMAGTNGLNMNVKETLDDPEFHKVCIDVGRNYDAIHEQKNWNYDFDKSLVAGLLDYGTQICTFDEFIKFIDHIVSKLSETCFEENIFLLTVNG